MRRLVQHVVPPSTGATVVDIGCGTGANIAALAGEYSCLGIDTSEEAISFARSRFPGVRFIQGVAPADLPEGGATADLFLLMDVLEHVEDDFAFLSELLAAAAPGAHLVLTVPADPSLWTEHDVSFGHFRRYDPPRLVRLWKGLPVSVRLLSHYNTRLYPIVRVMRAVSRWRGHASGRAGTDFSMPSPPVNALLERIIAGEGGVLVDLLEGRRARGFALGVSLIAVLRREPGSIVPAPTPPSVLRDRHHRENDHEP